MAVQHETELYEPIKSFWEAQGYQVKGEVKHCDLVAVHTEQEHMVIVEFKKTFNLALLLQAVDRLQMCEQVYVAVERNRTKKGAVNQRWGEITRLCKRLGVGLITVTFYKTKKPLVELLCEAPGGLIGPYTPRQVNITNSKPRISSKRKNRLLQEFKERSGDYNVGGSTQRKLVTAYREKALRIACCLQAHEQLSPRQLRELLGLSNAASMLQQNYYGWFMRVSRGKYQLSPAGHEALKQYADIIQDQGTSVVDPLSSAPQTRQSIPR